MMGNPMSFLRHFTQFSTMSSLNRPLYNAMTQKFTKAFSPTVLDIVDESTLHAEHVAMREYGYNETHFKITIVSDAFKGKLPVARHRMVYALLDDEFKQGLHAINIITKTPEEFNKIKET